jgi:hypothetical protein
MTNNKQQTALQILINGLIDRKKKIIKNADSMPNDMLEGGVMAFEGAIDLAQSLLVIEKEISIKFACDVHMNVKKDKVKSLMQLVDEKYKQTYGGCEQ